MESQRLEYVIKVTTAIVTRLYSVNVATPPQTPLSWILISSVIFTLITYYYKLILPHYAAIVLSLHISHSDIAFVVKFKLSEGLSEIWEGVREPIGAPRRRRRRHRPRPPASGLIFKDMFIYAWTIYLGSTVKFNAFYEYCELFWMSAMRGGGVEIAVVGFIRIVNKGGFLRQNYWNAQDPRRPFFIWGSIKFLLIAKDSPYQAMFCA